MSLKLISPWMNYYHEVREMFRLDDGVHVVYDDEENRIKLYVDSEKKADALYYVLPESKTFAGKTIYINVISPNGELKIVPSIYFSNESEVWECAFDGNKAFKFSETIRGVMSNPITYVVFICGVVQYYNDDLGDYYGQRSCLYEDIARDVFEHLNGVFFSTYKSIFQQEKNV